MECRTSSTKYGARSPASAVASAVRRGASSAAFASSVEITPCRHMACSTTHRRRYAKTGFLRGLSPFGAVTIPASSAASASVSDEAGLRKYSCAAASMPQAPPPK